jgi:menaquinone-dependent protoporphyrinogen oxidase
MNILVAYETAHGSTTGIAEAIAQAMQEAGAEVTVERCRKVEDVSGYDAFVIGSPIWVGKWLKPAAVFLKRNADAIAKHPHAIFLATAAAGHEAHKPAVMRDYVPKVLGLVPNLDPVAIGNFAGVLNFPRYPLPMRLIMAGISRSGGGPTNGYNDFRDWDEIKAWAEETYRLFAERLGEAGAGRADT